MIQMAKDLKPGDYVVMVNCAEAKKYKTKVWKVRSAPWKLDHGEEVILLEGKSGGFSTEYLMKL
jgi:hypothetical protein